MKTLIKAALLASATLGTVAIIPTIASAQAPVAIGVADLQDAVSKSNAMVLANNQIKITYKAQIDAYNARAAALEGELQGLVQTFQASQKAPTPNQQVLQTQYNAIQKKQADAKAELEKLGAPFNVAAAYAQSQIEGKMGTVLKSVMTKKRLAAVLRPEALWGDPDPSANVTNDVLSELNIQVPSVSTTPPPGWPNQQQGAAPRPATPATQPKPAPSGR